MKKIYIVLTVLAALASIPCVTQGADYKQVAATPHTTAACGTGWYLGLQGGANVYQDFGGDREQTVNGVPVTVGVNDHIGGYGGIKLGYIFGEGEWRFGLEEDLYYNGVDANAFARINNNEVASASALLNTAAFMTYLQLKYAPNGGCGLQPYIFGGVGGWWGEVGGDLDVTVNGINRSIGSKRDNGGFAFDLGAGCDYYFSPKWGVFVEYKFLDYTNAGNEFTNSNVGQHLVGGGLKFHF